MTPAGGEARCSSTPVIATKTLHPKVIHVDGAPFHYVEKGSGDPLVLVHGTLADYRTWRQQIDVFANSFHVVAYSRRYHYPGSWNGHRSDYSAARQGHDLVRLIETLRFTRAHIVASSFGAYISLFAAFERPGMIRSLVLGEPPCFPILRGRPDGPPYWEDFDRRAWTPARNSFAEGKDEDGVRFFMDGVLGQGAFDKLSHFARKMLLDNVSALKAEVSSTDYLSEFSCEMARSIGVPTLLLDGEMSPPMFHAITNELQRCMPHTVRLTVPAASHALHNQNAKSYNSIVIEFLRNLDTQHP